MPVTNPTNIMNPKVAKMHIQIGIGSGDIISMAKVCPPSATFAPMLRSNSPEIISMAAAMARMPT